MVSTAALIPRAVAAALLILALALPAAGQDASGSIDVELNKLEDRENGDCRAYMVFRNDTPERLAVFQLDLIMFDPEGIIERRLAVEAGPLNAGKTVVKLFDVTSLPCGDIGRILLNGVVDCRTDDGPASGCTRRTRVSARTQVPFIK